MKKKVLVIVAHPDDETIWMGGTILKNIKKWNLTIISLCRRDDKDRSPKFYKVCKLLNAKGFMSDLEDEKLNPQTTDEVIKRVREFAEKKYDFIFTHGKNGEYGHKRHVLAHYGVIEMLQKKIISCSKLFFFSCSKKGKYSYPNPNSDKFINLSSTQLDRKKNMIQNVYGFNKKSFEEICCRGKEAFNIGEIK